MKKKCMAIARKVMVWSLAASMLVATPLTASAKDLNSVYKIEDNSGNVVGNEENPNTGTVTSTNTSTSVLENEGRIEGIVLDETDVNLTLNDNKNNGEKRLEVTILGEGISEEAMAKLQRSITWKSSDTAVAALGNLAKENGGNTQSMLVKAKAGGKATVTVSLDDYVENIHFTATANVSVKEYAKELKFSTDYIPENADGRYGYVKHSVDLNAALIKTPATANDEVTFEIVDGYDNKTKKAATNIAAIDKKGVLTYKKEGWVKIVAIGERVKSQTLQINIEAGKPANKVEIWLDKEGETKKAPAQKPDVSKTEDRAIKVVAKLEVGKKKDEKHWAEGDKRNDCTDTIMWSSNKPAIVKVEANGDKAILVPTGVGSAVITAKASTGKKATLSVKVSATMTDIKITTANQDIYSGQTLKLTADRYFGTGEEYKNFPGSDSVTWYLVNNTGANKDSKYATIKKDVFTAKAKVDTVSGPVEVKVRSAKKYGTGSSKAYVETSSSALKLKLKQADVQTIEVIDGDTVRAKGGFKGAAAKLANAKDGTVVINAGNGKTFMVKATGSDGKTVIPGTNTPLATTLNIVSNKEKSAIASRDAQGNAVVVAPADAAKGTANITVSGTKLTNANKGTYGAVKATFKANVKIPARSIQLAYKQKVVKALTTTKSGETYTKKQTVKVAATLPKGTTTAATAINWEATLYDANNQKKNVAFGTIKNGKTGSITLPDKSYAAGDTLVVIARVTEKQNDNDKVKVGATSTIRIPVVTPSKKALIYNEATDSEFKNSKNKTNQADISLAANTVLNMKPMVDIGVGKASKIVEAGKPGDGYVAADVTYTVNKKGIVSIVDGKVTGIKAGTVKITATTSDGKKATLTVKVDK